MVPSAARQCLPLTTTLFLPYEGAMIVSNNTVDSFCFIKSNSSSRRIILLFYDCLQILILEFCSSSLYLSFHQFFQLLIHGREEPRILFCSFQCFILLNLMVHVSFFWKVLVVLVQFHPFLIFEILNILSFGSLLCYLFLFSGLFLFHPVLDQV